MRGGWHVWLNSQRMWSGGRPTMTAWPQRMLYIYMSNLFNSLLVIIYNCILYESYFIILHYFVTIYQLFTYLYNMFWCVSFCIALWTFPCNFAVWIKSYYYGILTVAFVFWRRFLTSLKVYLAALSMVSWSCIFCSIPSSSFIFSSYCCSSCFRTAFCCTVHVALSCNTCIYMRTGPRLRALSCRTQRYRKSFVPNSIHVTNNQWCRLVSVYAACTYEIQCPS